MRLACDDITSLHDPSSRISCPHLPVQHGVKEFMWHHIKQQGDVFSTLLATTPFFLLHWSIAYSNKCTDQKILLLTVAQNTECGAKSTKTLHKSASSVPVKFIHLHISMPRRWPLSWMPTTTSENRGHELPVAEGSENRDYFDYGSVTLSSFFRRSWWGNALESGEAGGIFGCRLETPFWCNYIR